MILHMEYYSMLDDTSILFSMKLRADRYLTKIGMEDFQTSKAIRKSKFSKKTNVQKNKATAVSILLFIFGVIPAICALESAFLCS